MRYLRIGAFCFFALSLIIYLYADLRQQTINAGSPPEISCPDGIIEVKTSDGPEALLAPLTAYDPDDGNLTDKIMVASTSFFLEPGIIKAKYVVFDSDNNSDTVTSMVRFIDYSSPKFELLRPLVFQLGDNIRYLNYVTARDALDGDISDRIKVKSSSVSNYTEGSYPVLLEVTNSYGDTVSVELNVVVSDTREENTEISLDRYLVYIDQGSSFDPHKLISSVKKSGGQELDKKHVSILGSLDTEKPGFYHLVYSYDRSDCHGKTYLTVVVREKEA